LLNAQHNFSWLSGGGSNGIDMSRENGAGFLFVTWDGGRYVIANNIEISRLLTEEISEDEFQPIEITWQAEKDPQTILNAAKSVAKRGNFGCDIGFPETRMIEPSIAGCRAELTAEEIDRYKQLGSDAGQALENVFPLLAPGQTETQVARIVRDALQAFDIYPVVTLIGGDDRIAKFRHPVATDNVWTNTLLIVVCARRHGLVASLSRMICAGQVPAELQRRTEACAAVNAALYKATLVGTMGSDLYKTAADAYAAQGFHGEIDKHHQGGAAGYRTRDWVAHPGSKDAVQPNQAFAWNPSITGTKTEETAILIDDELRIITATNGFPKITTVIDGKEYYSPGILSLSKGASA
jgi:Xaa-Pro aminopeptidase